MVRNLDHARQPRPICVGVVLAGGRSLRMGRDKALLPYRGRPLIEHMIALLQSANLSNVVVSGDYPQYQGIPDEHYQRGPLAGIFALYRRYADEQVLLIPVDMPNLTSACLNQLIAYDNRVNYVRYAQHIFPMRLRLDLTVLRHLHELLATPIQDGLEKPSLHALLLRLSALAIDDSALENSIFQNINTPQNWHELQQ